MIEVAPAFPRVGERGREVSRHAPNEPRGRGRGVSASHPEHVQEEAHPRQRPEIDVAAQPMRHVEPDLDVVDELAIALLD